MHTDETTNMSTRLSRALKGGMAIALAAVITAWAPTSDGASGTARKSDGTQICSYSGFSFDSTSNILNITCDTQVPGQPGTFSVSASPIQVVPGGTATVNVLRSGGSTGTYSVAYTATVTGLTGATLNATAIPSSFTSSLDFAEGETVKPYTFNAGTTEGSLTLALGAVTPTGTTTAATTTAGATTATITVANGTTPPPGCTTSATYNTPFTVSGQKIVFKLKPGETAAASFTPAANQTIKVSTTDTVNTPPTADHEVAVSQCPGDFTPVWPCEYQTQYTGSTMTTQSATTAPIYACKLTAGTKYYMNVRQVVKGNTSVNSCPLTTTGCEVRVEIQISSP
jgi:hypothetical protein